MSTIPERGDPGRLNVRPGHPLPIMSRCRWCREPLRVRRSVVFCPRCDRTHEMTLPRNRGEEGTHP